MKTESRDPLLETVLEDEEIFRAAAMRQETGRRIYAYFETVIDKRLANPGDDIVSYLTTAEIDALARFESSGLVVMAGHTFVYNGAVRYVKNLIDFVEQHPSL